MKRICLLGLLFGCIVYCLGCNSNDDGKSNRQNIADRANVNNLSDTKGFDTTIDGKKVGLFTLSSTTGLKMTMTNYGGRIVSLLVPDKKGSNKNVVVGFNSVREYVQSSEPYFGATIGRYANRIAKGRFSLNGKEYQLSINNGDNTLHGGKTGFQSVVWDAVQLNDSTLKLHYLSKDGEDGFPGNLDVEVVYSLTREKGLRFDFKATTDKETVINFTNHAFFNLNGEGSGSILTHTMQIFADKFTPINSELIPIGKIVSIKNTPFDFSVPEMIGERIDENDDQLKNGNGYDHNFVLNGMRENGMNHAATVIGDKSGIILDVFTEEPGLQFYSGNFMLGKNTFSNGSKDEYRTAFVLEPQHFPDSPNEPSFPSTILKSGQTFKTSSLYLFRTQK